MDAYFFDLISNCSKDGFRIFTVKTCKHTNGFKVGVQSFEKFAGSYLSGHYRISGIKFLEFLEQLSRLARLLPRCVYHQKRIQLISVRFHRPSSIK
jgi:hypothetical protein